MIPYSLKTKYQPLKAKVPGVYFGYDLSDYGGKAPIKWMADNKDLFVFPIEAISASREPYDYDKLPDDSGVYFLFLGEVLQYVGISKLICDRLRQHRYPNRPSLVQADWFDSWAALWAPFDMCRHVECYYIHKLRPPKNSSYPTAYGLSKEWLKG
jgi:hypothetical protein